MKGRIVFNQNLNEEELCHAYMSYAEDKKKDLAWAHSHPLWNEMKCFIESQRKNILKQVRNNIVNSKSNSMES